MIPSDRMILEKIYKKYEETFSGYNIDQNSRKSKIFVPISCQQVAKELGTDPDIVFGRLYYFLEEKYGYTRADKSNVSFFALTVGDEKHCINFPLMVSVLAGLQEEAKKHRWSMRFSIGSLIVAISSASITIYSTLIKAFG